MFVTCVVNGIADDFDWPRRRGPNGDGISQETDWNPEALVGNPKILWKVDVGAGRSNIAIKNNHLYTMGIGKKRKENAVYCFNANNGEAIWQYTFETMKNLQWPQSTPSIDGKYVYAISKEAVLLCLKAKKRSPGSSVIKTIRHNRPPLFRYREKIL